MAFTPTRVALVAAVSLAVGIALYADGRKRWFELPTERLLYGVPWGTALTIAIVGAFYLLVQGGLAHWTDPVIYAFVTWSHFYPTGLLTAGIAHGSPDHLLGNLTGTLVFGAIAEYAWGHYPSTKGDSRAHARTTDRGSDPGTPRSDGTTDGFLARPWIRAVVVVPAAMLAAAFLTGVFSLSGLGFSGAVYALLGFALVLRPLAAVVGVVVSSALSVLLDAITEPVVRETIAVGPPMPPAWAGTDFLAHLLGFLLGVLVGIAILARQRRRPTFGTITFGVLVVGWVQALWLLPWPADDEYALYQGIGVLMVTGLALVIAAAVDGSDRDVPRPLGEFRRLPSRRTLALAWLALVTVGTLAVLAGVVVAGEGDPLVVATVVVLAALLAVPGLPAVLPDRVFPTPVSRRHVALTCLVVFTLLLALVTVPIGLVAVDDEAMPTDGAVTAGDYAVTYEENTSTGHRWVFDDEGGSSDASGVIVVSEERELWIEAVRADSLAFDGEDEITVGGIGWRETVEVERTGWEVLGNETAYAVDLELDGEWTRAYTSDPVRANAEFDGYAVEVVPTEDGFDLVAWADGETVGTAPIPDVGQSTTVGDLSVETVEEGEAVRVVVETGEVRLPIAERETYH